MSLPLLAANYQTLIGLLAVTGLRLGEVIRLNRGDIDVRHGLLRILDSKFSKSREVVLHDTTMHALNEYARLWDRRFPQPRVNGHRFLPTGGHLIPRWWPSFLPAGGHRMSPLVAIVSPHPRGGVLW